MKIELFIKGRPLSLNKAYKTLPNGRRAKSQHYTEFQRHLERSINQNTLRPFKDAFDSSIHELKLTMIIYISDLYTKQGRVSELSGDCDNYVKVVNDFVFKQMGVDDCLITDLRVTKNQGREDCFLYILEIKK